MNIITLKNIHFSYPEEIKVFEDFNLTIKQGDRLGIMGLNGSGKTTLLYLIMGLLKPQHGKVVIWGQARRTEAEFEDVRKRIGYLFQDPDDQLFSPTVEEDIAFGPLNLKKELSVIQKSVDQVCEDLKISHLKKRICSKLSWGQKRLVSLAGLLAMNPEVLIFDEPTASIDQDVVQRITAYLQSSNQTLIIVSHDEPFLRMLCQQVFFLRGSALVQAK